MKLAVEILFAWFAASIITAPVLIPLLKRRFARHDAWVERDLDQSRRRARPQ